MDPLMITATPNICWLHPELDYPRTAADFASEARRCQEAGAQIIHMHAEDWPGWVAAVRAETDMIVQCGMSSLAVEERLDIFRARADLISMIVSHHDEAFVGQDFHVLHPREELARYAQLSREHGVRLEYEVWHSGSIWNLCWMRDQGLIDLPYFTSVFFGWPGGTWSPPTVEEYEYRRRLMPEGCVATVSVMDPAQRQLLAAAIAAGDHIRVGTEDYPFARDGRPAPTHTLVSEAVELADALGRPLASVPEARRLSGLSVA
jgi:3-keto-5-aminohexanoate cleavage enzyme